MNMKSGNIFLGCFDGAAVALLFAAMSYAGQQFGVSRLDVWRVPSLLVAIAAVFIVSNGIRKWPSLRSRLHVAESSIPAERSFEIAAGIVSFIVVSVIAEAVLFF
ncbi:hypothetical protein KW799_02080 [Candidatus Parcubacteria bacterium]|nr:hypothetical protein [Candidatus Parcubacteria bacterium]